MLSQYVLAGYLVVPVMGSSVQQQQYTMVWYDRWSSTDGWIQHLSDHRGAPLFYWHEHRLELQEINRQRAPMSRPPYPQQQQ